jgi:predicted alpha-1,2-mannosidase
MGRYTQLGYVPLDESGRSVGMSVEYSHADFALANLGRTLGHVSDADALAQRARGWRKLFDPTTKVLRPRDAAGGLDPAPYSLEGWDGYAEANALQTTWMPWWDLEGFDVAFGSRAEFLSELEAFFDASPGEHAAALAQPTYELRWLERYHYWPSNEPDVHTPFMFSAAGRPDLTAKWSDWARDTFYAATPEGLPGNDDGGAISGVYVFAAAGLFPIAGTDQWVIGSPLFPKLELTLPGARTFTIEAKNVSAENLYVQSATLNGKALETSVLSHAQLATGATLVLTMGAMPSAWARR